jgi:polysaccharide deacetylase 2 family uncharacterized protein YibQ
MLVGVVVAAVGVTAAAVLIDPVELDTAAPDVPVAETPGTAPEVPEAEAAVEPPEAEAPEAADDPAEPEAEVGSGADIAAEGDSAPEAAGDTAEEQAEEMTAEPSVDAQASEGAQVMSEAPESTSAPEVAGSPAPDTTPAPSEDVDAPAREDEVAALSEPAPAAEPVAPEAPGNVAEGSAGDTVDAEAEEAAPEAAVVTPSDDPTDPAVTDTMPAGEGAESGERAQLPTVVAPANPTTPDVRMPEEDGTLRTAGQSSFDPPPLPEADDRLEEDAPNPDAEVVTDRLPSIGETVAQEAAEAGPQPAIRRNGLPFESSPGLPQMAVVLLDTGPGRSEVGDLAVMPFPLSVAVDASAPDAEEAIRFYRDNGAEVVLIVPLPDLATAMDVEVTFQAYAPLMKDVVAVMIERNAGFQGLGEAAAQIVTNVDERGLGLVTYPEGLNTGHKTAIRDDVPAGLVFRDLDGEGQTGDVIRRFLDNVAFRARNEERVIAVARVRPESIQALLEWSLGNRAQTVDFAPVSAVLLDAQE